MCLTILIVCVQGTYKLSKKIEQNISRDEFREFTHDIYNKISVNDEKLNRNLREFKQDLMDEIGKVKIDSQRDIELLKSEMSVMKEDIKKKQNKLQCVFNCKYKKVNGHYPYDVDDVDELIRLDREDKDREDKDREDEED